VTDGLDARRVSDIVSEAFAHAEYPGDAHIVYDNTDAHPEAQQISRYFRGKRWREVDLPFVKRYDESADASTCLTFMSPEGFRYYLPAFLLLMIRFREELGLVFDTTISKLAPWANTSDQQMVNFVAQRLAGFTPTQAQAIVTVLQYLREAYPDDPAVDEIDRALEFWLFSTSK